jgi:threonine synthase
MVYYFHAVAQVPGGASSAVVVCTPSGNFGNLTAGLFAKRSGLPIVRFVAATNVNDVVPVYLATGRFEPRASVPTIANAMDVGNPSNFERMRWLYKNDPDAMRADVVGSRHADPEVRQTIKRVYDARGYVLDPHSAIAYQGLRDYLDAMGADDSGRRAVGVFLATAHPAKFAEVVEPVIGRRLSMPERLAEALARSRHLLRLDATLDAVADALCG